MKKTTLALALALLAAAPRVGVAQSFAPHAAPDPAALAALKKLDFLVGDWAGESVYEMGGRTSKVRQVESVKRALSGLALLVEGRGFSRGADGAEVVQHDALGVMTYDRAAGRYRFIALKAPGDVVEPEVTVADGSFTWGFATPQGIRFRYTMKITPDGKWNEVGEMSRDGSTWQKTMEMNLTKR